MDGLSVASTEDDSTADGGGGGGGAGGGDGANAVVDRVTEETRRCNANRAARPSTLTAGTIASGGSGHGRMKNQQQRQQQQQQQLLHQQQQHGGKKQKKQHKWKANKYRGGRGNGADRKVGAPRGRKENLNMLGARKSEDISSNNGIISGEDPGLGGTGGAGVLASGDGHSQHQLQPDAPGSFHQLQQTAGKNHPQSTTAMSNNIAQQSSHVSQQTTSSVGTQQGHGGPQPPPVVQSQKSKHSNKQQNLSPMGLRNKRLQSVSKYFLPDKRPRKDCIVPPTKFLLGGNISDPLNLNSLQNESENAVTPKSSPIPTPPHYKAKIDVIIPPNINDPLHLLDPVDSVEYEMQLCSPMKRKQRPRNKRKRKSRIAAERNVDGPPLLAADQLLPPSGAVAESATSGAPGLEEAATAEEASFTGIGQKFSDAGGADRFSLAIDSFSFSDSSASHHHHQHLMQSGGAGTGADGLLLQQNHSAVSGGTAGVGVAASGSSMHIGSGGSATSGSVPQLDILDREREKAMRNLKLDLESAGGRKRRTSESTNSTKNKLRRMDSMDKIVSPVIPQPGGWKRAHWPASAGGTTGAAGSAGRNRTRTYSTASNTDEQQHAEEGTAVERGTDSQAAHEASRHQSTERSDAFTVGELNPQLFAAIDARGDEYVQQGGEQGRLMVVCSVEEGRTVDQRTADTVSIIPRPMTALAASSRYHYGNYDRYYGYHSLNEFIDVRLKVFLRNPYLFRDKDVLDIGCNVGLMTIAVAKMLHTKTATGIDVDNKLIAKARKNLANYVRIPKKVPTMTVTGARRTIAAATITSAASQEPEQTPEVKMEQDPLQASNSVPCSESQIDPALPLTGSKRTDEASESVPEGEVVVVVVADSSNPAQVLIDLEVENADRKVEVDEQGQISDGDGPLKALMTDQELEHTKAMDLKSPDVMPHRRQKRRRKPFGGKRHGKNHQQHHHQSHHLRHQSYGNGRGKAEYAHYFPISFPLTMGNLSGKEYQMDIGRTANKFPHNVRFKTMNYVVKDESFINNDTQQYDLILCLSVTKWIHLNYGDVGLKIAFKRMFNHLRPGGKLILEAQNWASYKKKKKLTETIFENYKNIEFFPNRFHDYLLSPEVGFSHSYPLGIPRHLGKGFRRPIQLYIKGDFTPSQAKWSDTYHPGTPYENHRGIYTDIVTASQTTANCIWGAMTPYAPSYSYRQPSTPSHVPGGSGGGGASSGSGGGSGGFACTSPYYNPRQTDSYLPSYDNVGNNHRPGSYCFASPLYYSTTWSPPSEMLATSGGGGGSYRRSASNTPNSASIRSTDNDEHYYTGTAGGGSQRRHHVYPPIDVFSPMFGHDHMRSSGSFRSGGGGGGGSGTMTDSDSEPSSNSASQTPTRQQQFLTDDQSNSPSGHSQPDK